VPFPVLFLALPGTVDIPLTLCTDEVSQNQLSDSLQTIGSKPMEEEEMITLIKWMTKFRRIEPHIQYRILRYFPQGRHSFLSSGFGQETPRRCSGVYRLEQSIVLCRERFNACKFHFTHARNCAPCKDARSDWFFRSCGSDTSTMVQLSTD
jgi:hypothetical protein